MPKIKGDKENELAFVCMPGGLYLHQGEAMDETTV